jgi:hypothetical protein
MDKSDWYFVIGTILGLSAFFGVDWKRVKKFMANRGKPMPEPASPARQILFLVLIVASLLLSSIGWYKSYHREPLGPPTGFTVTHWENFIPADHRYGSGVKVTIATENIMKGPIQFFIIFDGDIEQFPTGARFTNGGPFTFESQELLKSHADVFNVKWRTPEWTPSEFVEMEFLSRYPRRPKWVIPINYNPNL